MNEKKPPNLLRRGRNFAGAMAKAGKAVISGEAVFCPTFDSDQRLLICEMCIDNFNAEKRICTHSDCGCYVDAKAKLKTEHCPLKKWPGDILF